MHLLQSIKIVIIFSVLAIISACSGYENNQLSDQPISELIHSQIQIESQWSRDGAYYVSPSLSADLPQFRVGLMLTLIEGTPKSAPIPVWARGINEQGEQTRWHEASWTWIEDPQRVGLVDFNSGMTAGQIRIHEEDVNLSRQSPGPWYPLRRASTDRIDGISGTQVSVQQALDLTSQRTVLSRERRYVILMVAYRYRSEVSHGRSSHGRTCKYQRRLCLEDSFDRLSYGYQGLV